MARSKHFGVAAGVEDTLGLRSSFASTSGSDSGPRSLSRSRSGAFGGRDSRAAQHRRERVARDRGDALDDRRAPFAGASVRDVGREAQDHDVADLHRAAVDAPGEESVARLECRSHARAAHDDDGVAATQSETEHERRREQYEGEEPEG